MSVKTTDAPKAPSKQALSLTRQIDRAVLLLFRQAKEQGEELGDAVGGILNLMREPATEPTAEEALAVRILREAISSPVLSSVGEDDPEFVIEPPDA